ncbi:MAG TPA: TIGR03085 family metal-binding protein [Streptosporangiaceae bacterium]|jgi:uncharacterized protein (TIGR03085 family)|nr:TIGR03085 family metal-binding protein [Streptosporangiaceae bacterium]
MTFARDERLALCALLDQAGPQAPTLCEGWTTLDLAAHLVIRERRLDAAAGMLGGPFAGHAKRVQDSLTERTPFSDIVQAIRSGPPRLSLFGVPGMDERANVVEFFVHHEDVRRATDGWEERKVTPRLAEALWRRLSMARFILRKAPVGVELARDDVQSTPGKQRVRITAKARTPVVTVTGSPAELTLWALGRTSVAQVRLDGVEAALSALRSATWRI